MTARNSRTQRTVEQLLEHLKQRFEEHETDDAWIGQRASDIAQEIGWPTQRVGPALRKLQDQGHVKAVTEVRVYGRSRRMDETRYRLTPAPVWPAVMFGLLCRPAGLR